MKQIHMMAVCAALSVTGGCTTSVVKSWPATAKATPKGYLSYAVAESMIVVDITEIKDAPPAKADAPPPSSDTAPAPTTTTVSPGATVKVEVALPSGAAPAPKSPAKKEDPPKPAPKADAVTPTSLLAAADLCAKAKVELQKVPPAHQALVFAGASIQPRLRAAAVEATLSDAEKKALLVDLTDYAAKFAAAKVLDDTAVDFKRIVAATCPVTPPSKIQVAISHKLAPARGRSFVLALSPNDISADTLALKITTDGFFSSIGVTAEDQTITAASNLIGSVGTVIGAAGGDAASGPSLANIGPLPLSTETLLVSQPSAAGSLKPESALPGAKPPAKTKTIICPRGGDLPAVVAALKRQPVCLTPRAIAALQAKIVEISATLAEQESQPTDPDIPLPRQIVFALGDLKGDQVVAIRKKTYLHLLADCSATPPAPTPTGVDNSVPIRGVALSTFRGCRVSAWLKGDDKVSGRPAESTANWVADQQVWAADPDRLMVAAIERTTFVSRPMNYGFDSGRVTSVNDKRDSPASAAAAAPGALVGAFFGGVVNGITGRKSVVDAQTSLQASKTGLINAQTDQIKALSAQIGAQTDQLKALTTLVQNQVAAAAAIKAAQTPTPPVAPVAAQPSSP